MDFTFDLFCRQWITPFLENAFQSDYIATLRNTLHKICFTVNLPDSLIKNNVQKMEVLPKNKQNI